MLPGSSTYSVKFSCTVLQPWVHNTIVSLSEDMSSVLSSEEETGLSKESRKCSCVCGFRFVSVDFGGICIWYPS